MGKVQQKVALAALNMSKAQITLCRHGLQSSFKVATYLHFPAFELNVLTRLLALVLRQPNLLKRHFELATDIKELYLPCATYIKVRVAESRLGAGMTQDVADIAILTNDALEIILEIQK